MNLLSSVGRVLVGCSICFAFIGCKKHGESSHQVPTPIATDSAPTIRPTPRPSVALWVDGVSYRFPPATLILSPQGEGISATLCSDDPPTPVRSNDHGNSFMIQMQLDIVSADELEGYVWNAVVDSTADVDSNTGVFLDGMTRQLQPTVLSVSFHKRGDDLIADVDGQFQSLDSQDPSARRRSVAVTGRLYTQVIDRP